ncbi:pyridoxamine 5'-phosphate oxidase family protein [Pseudozobellia thermophila]|uniref:Flavin mononucleotide-binding protein n=1 Tax=Pseudozobellia thermophila TaxID=192903 RepID=A0A1M6L6D7_9FLAO|nr:pyridoxamine 5'-phosphate oxidase family protein [Pseudozobellia thermophila]SHJ66750.1 hypothetical protein SAMN04488513_10739 [Pseudozobellia thermophila]
MIKNLEIQQCIQLLGKNYIARLGYIYGSTPHVIPITYFHDAEEKCIISYSSEGHKLDAMRRFDSVSLQVDEITDVHHWQSVLVQGRFQELKGSTAKKYLHKFAEGVQRIIEDHDGDAKFISDFSSRIFGKEAPVVFIIRINAINGKERTGK